MSTKKRVTVFKNGTNRNGKLFALDPDSCQIDGLLEAARQRFGDQEIAHLYTTDGLEIADCTLIRKKETLYYALVGEEFMPQQQPTTSTNKVSSVDTLKLNVGGVMFETTRGTLANSPNSKLAKMFDPKSEVPTPPCDDNGAYFIDRDPKYFAPILNYLRTGKLVFGKGVKAGIRGEADFYGIVIRSLVPRVVSKRDLLAILAFFCIGIMTYIWLILPSNGKKNWIL